MVDNLEPLGNYVLIKRDPPDTLTKAGLVLPDTYSNKERPWSGEILAVPHRPKERFTNQPFLDKLSPGMRVIFHKWTGQKFLPYNVQDQLYVDINDILAIIEEE